MIVVTGATGKLGRHVVEGLLKKVPAKEVAVAVRDAAKAADLAARGVTVRAADYAKPETLASALAGAERLLLISSSELGQREAQHKAVVAAAKAAGVKLLAYTSLLRADTARISLAAEHRATEEAIRASGIPYVFLRDGWYLENYTENLGSALSHGVILGSAGEGRVAAASRADYAAAAVEALTGAGHAGRTYELAGDRSFSMAELAAEVSRASGRPVAYRDLPEKEYAAALAGFGLPVAVAEMLADADAALGRGELDAHGDDLRRLIGRPTTTLAEAVAAALA